MPGLHCHTIKTKNRSHSINEVKKLGYEIRRQDFDLCSTQIYRALYSCHVGAIDRKRNVITLVSETSKLIHRLLIHLCALLESFIEPPF